VSAVDEHETILKKIEGFLTAIDSGSKASKGALKESENRLSEFGEVVEA
jgi:hypothetical protein